MATADIQTGKGILFGVSSISTGITMTGFVTFTLESGRATHKFKLDSVEDELGSDAALIATNGHVEIDLTWTPSGATRAAAATTAVMLTPLSKVTLTNFAVTPFNGDWVYIGDESIDLSHGPAKIGLKVRKYDNSTQNSSLTTTVTG